MLIEEKETAEKLAKEKEDEHRDTINASDVETPRSESEQLKASESDKEDKRVSGSKSPTN